MKRHYIATLHVLVELDDDVPGMSNCPAAACDAISEWMREAHDSAGFKDWGYARTKTLVDPKLGSDLFPPSCHAAPVEVTVDADDYEEGGLYKLLPATHIITHSSDDPDREEAIVALAQEQSILREGTLEVDDGATISEGDDNGAYVQAWLWVDFAGTPLDKATDDEDESESVEG